MKKETLRYQRLAGIITESQYSSKLNEYDDFNSESESVFFGQLADKLKTFLQSEINLEDLEIDGVKIPEEETLRDAVDGMMEILGIVMKGKAYTIGEKEVSPAFLNRFKLDGESDSTRGELDEIGMAAVLGDDKSASKINENSGMLNENTEFKVGDSIENSGNDGIFFDMDSDSEKYVELPNELSGEIVDIKNGFYILNAKYKGRPKGMVRVKISDPYYRKR